MGAPKLRVLCGEWNADYAAQLRELADRIEASREPVRGYAGVVVFADGNVGSTHDGPAEAALVGALEMVQQRILQAWS